MAIFPLHDLLIQHIPCGSSGNSFILPCVGVVDVGAMSLGESSDVYQDLLQNQLCTVVGFEPLEAECNKLIAAAEENGRSKTHKFFPYFIGDGNKGTFYQCNEVMTSSLYKPNTELAKRFSHLEEVMRVDSVTEVSTTRLDDLVGEIGPIDFVKLDVQGGELDVIRGGTNALQQACVLQTEVEFVPLYEDQPLFADVDTALRALGFVFHRFAGMAGRTMKPLVVKDNPFQPISQHLWSDAVYVRDMFALSSYTPEKLLKLAIILHQVYQSYDVVHHVLVRYEQIAGSTLIKSEAGLTLSEAYYQRLTGTPRPSTS